MSPLCLAVGSLHSSRGGRPGYRVVSPSPTYSQHFLERFAESSLAFPTPSCLLDKLRRLLLDQWSHFRDKVANNPVFSGLDFVVVKGRKFYLFHDQVRRLHKPLRTYVDMGRDKRPDNFGNLVKLSLLHVAGFSGLVRINQATNHRRCGRNSSGYYCWRYHAFNLLSQKLFNI